MSSIRIILAAFEEEAVELPRFEHGGDLDEIFRLLNHVQPGDGARMPTGGKHRSLSAGDIVVRDGVAWGCAMMGWYRMTPVQVKAYVEDSTMLERLSAYRRWEPWCDHAVGAGVTTGR